MYKYYLNARPASPGAVPNGFAKIDEQDKGGKYGAIYYESPLTDIQMIGYELQPTLSKEQEAFLDVFKSHLAVSLYYYFKMQKCEKAERDNYTKLFHEQCRVVSALKEAAKAIEIDENIIVKVSCELNKRLKKTV